jgi:hypothetical protein
VSCCEHESHAHKHGPSCGHKAVRHGDHADYLHDGHLHAPHEDHLDEHRLEVDRKRPGLCAPIECGEEHGESCLHERVPHGDHLDYDVEGALHHPHGAHCDLHGLLPGEKGDAKKG